MTTPDVLPKAIFEFTDESQVDTAWYVPLDGADWMAVLFSDTPTSPWRVTFRFRYYASDEAWDAKDRKNAYEVTTTDHAPATADRLREALTLAYEELAKNAIVKPTIVRVNGPAAEFLKVWSKQKFAHVKVMPPTPGSVS